MRNHGARLQDARLVNFVMHIMVVRNEVHNELPVFATEGVEHEKH